MNVEDPRIRAGLAAQADLRRDALQRAGRLGWKAGVGTAAAMQRIGTSAPLVGFMTDATLLADGASCDITGWANPRLEAEVAVRLGADVPAGATAEQARDAIEAIAPAIELVDPGEPDDVEAVLADNIWHRAVVLGAFAPAGDLDAARIDVATDGAADATAVDPRALLGDLVDVVRGLADQLPLADDAIRAGDVIITGAVVPAYAVAPGQTWTVALSGGAATSVRIA
jgi:2-keto-4-pentenoate hydratase